MDDSAIEDGIAGPGIRFLELESRDLFYWLHDLGQVIDFFVLLFVHVK